MDEKDSELRGKLAKEGRLWGLALVCAPVGALTVALTDSVPTGVLADAVGDLHHGARSVHRPRVHRDLHARLVADPLHPAILPRAPLQERMHTLVMQ